MVHPALEDQPALELAVERAAAIHEERSYRSDGKYTRFFHLGDFYDQYHDLSVKYTDHVTLVAENLTLKYLYALACEDGDAAPHVPRPVHYFYRPGGLGYIVMERVEVVVVPDDELYIKTARAVQWLRTKGPHPKTLFGSMGGSYARHTVFKSGTAPQRYKSVAAAEKYFNTVIHKAQRSWNPLIDVALVNEKVVLTQSDMHAGNFGASPDGRPIIFDAATIQALPVTLADFTLLRTTPFAKEVSKHVFEDDEKAALLASPSIAALAEARRLLFMAADDSFGVDEDGNYTPRIRSC